MGGTSSEIFRARVFRSPLFAGLIIVALVAAVYARTFHSPLLFDDGRSINQNPSIRKLWAINEVFAPSEGSLTRGRPISNLSFAASYALSGLDPWGYHVVNVTIHGLAALVLCGIVRRTLTTPLLREKFGEDAPLLAFAIAALWAVHPLQTQTVTYISQRTEALMAIFYLLTLYCFIRGTAGRAGLWHPLAVAACLLGAMSKEVIVTAPVVVLLYDRTFVAGTFRGVLAQRWRLYVGLATSWLLLAWLLLDVKTRGVGTQLGITSLQYAFTECKALLVYLSLCVWPHPLIFDRSPVFLKTFSEALPFAIPLAGILGGVFWSLVRWPAIGFTTACFFVLLAPTSSFVPIIGAPIAENRPYLPLAAVITLVVVGLQTWTGRRIALVACSGLIAAGGIAAFSRNHDYQDAIGIWTDTVAKAPDNPRAHNNLALLLEGLAGRQADALAHYETAVRLEPDYAEAHNNLAILLESMPGRSSDALVHYETALRLKPDSADIHYNFANLLASKLGRSNDAIDHFETALRQKPNYAEAHFNLALILATRPARQADALAHYEAALRVKPDFGAVHLNLANLLASQTGRQADTLFHYEAALRLNPDHAEIHYSLANYFVSLPGRDADALSHFESAIRLSPTFAEAHNNLGDLLARQPGRQADALAHFETALRLQPNNAIINLNMAEQLEKSPERRSEALAYYATALKLDPNLTAARDAIARLQKTDRR